MSIGPFFGVCRHCGQAVDEAADIIAALSRQSEPEAQKEGKT